MCSCPLSDFWSGWPASAKYNQRAGCLQETKLSEKRQLFRRECALTEETVQCKPVLGARGSTQESYAESRVWEEHHLPLVVC